MLDLRGTHFFFPFDLFFLDFLEDLSFCCIKRFICFTSSIKKALTILKKVYKIQCQERYDFNLLVSNLSVGQFTAVGSGNSSLGDGESWKSWWSELGNTWHALTGASLQVVNCELATYTAIDEHQIIRIHNGIEEIAYLGSWQSCTC